MLLLLLLLFFVRTVIVLMVVPVNLIFALKAAIVYSLMLCCQSLSKRDLELSSIDCT